MHDRTERALLSITRRYAPHLVESYGRAGTDPLRLFGLAKALARNNVLVISGALPPELTTLSGVYINDWVSHYTDLYTRLCQALFPSYMTCTAYSADDNAPPIMLIFGETTPPIMALADYIAPFVAAKQSAIRAGAVVTDMELLGLMDHMLDDLEAGDLPRAEYRRLQADGAGIVRLLLDGEVRQQLLTLPAPSLGIAINAPPSPVNLPPDLPEKPVPPPDLPEADGVGQPGFSGSDVPVFFSPSSRGTRRPPVPDLPE
jgi:hypothetical protein